jgi:hypothetical protein
MAARGVLVPAALSRRMLHAPRSWRRKPYSPSHTTKSRRPSGGANSCVVSSAAGWAMAVYPGEDKSGVPRGRMGLSGAMGAGVTYGGGAASQAQPFDSSSPSPRAPPCHPFTHRHALCASTERGSAAPAMHDRSGAGWIPLTSVQEVTESGHSVGPTPTSAHCPKASRSTCPA